MSFILSEWAQDDIDNGLKETTNTQRYFKYIVVLF